MRTEDGATLLESIFAVGLLMIMTVGTIQVALLLYARNLVQASAHEAARAAVERDVLDDVATDVARRVVHTSVAPMTRRVEVAVGRTSIGIQDVVTVKVDAILKPHGPIPVSFPVHAVARLSTTGAPE